jgi:hypothetical protein
MPRVCTLCIHPDRQAIETALHGGTSLRTIAAAWSVSKTALLRHRDAHGGTAPQPAQQPALQGLVLEEPSRRSPTPAPDLAALETVLHCLHQQLLALKETTV